MTSQSCFTDLCSKNKFTSSQPTAFLPTRTKPLFSPANTPSQSLTSTQRSRSHRPLPTSFLVFYLLRKASSQ